MCGKSSSSSSSRETTFMLIIFGMSNIRSSRNGSSRWDKNSSSRLDQRRCSTTKLPCWELRPFQRECRGRVQQPITQWLGSCYDRCLFAHLPNYHSGFQPDILHTHCVYACEYKWVPRVFFMAHFLWRNAASQCASSLCIFLSPCVLLMARFE